MRKLLPHFIIFLVFIAVAIYITYPLIFGIESFATGYGDELVIAWIQNWVLHSLLSGNILHIFEANLYYPYHNTLSFSETFILTSILALPVKLLVGEPISTVNFTLISSLVFFGFSVYLLSFYITKNFVASLFAGILLIFSPAVLDYMVHLQVLSLQCVPLAILFFLHFMKTRKSRFLIISLLFFVLQIYNSIMPGYFIVFSYVIICIFDFAMHKRNTIKLFFGKNLFILFISLLCLVPIAIPYFSVSREFNYVRDIRDAVHFAMQLEDFLYPGITTRIHPVLMNYIPTNHYSQNNEFKSGYLGVVFSLLVIFAFWYILKNFKKNNTYINIFFFIAIVGLILSLGPVLHLGRQTVHTPFLIPLPYALFYFVLPGFQGFRNSGRWEIVFILAMAVAIAIILHKLLVKVSLKNRVILYSLLFAGVVLEFNFPLKFYAVPQVSQFPQVYHWLASTEKNTKIIELPIYNWNMNPYTQKELWREYYGTLHFRRTVNGYTGFSPPPWQNFIYKTMSNFPSEESVKEIKKLEMNYIIVHKEEFDLLHKEKFTLRGRLIPDGTKVIRELNKNKELRLVKKIEEIYVYSY